MCVDFRVALQGDGDHADDYVRRRGNGDGRAHTQDGQQHESRSKCSDNCACEIECVKSRD